MESSKKCTSCKIDVVNLSGSVLFSCPSCGNNEIIRCSHCRDIGVRYSCVCGFTGPY